MSPVFLDASYFIALLLTRDALHAQATRIGRKLAGRELVTSENVLVEVLAHMSRLGPHARESGALLVDRLRSSIMIVPQTTELFEDGLRLYRSRLDKTYSLTDCMSMAICRRLGISEVLTHDRNFQQEGFTILL